MSHFTSGFMSIDNFLLGRNYLVIFILVSTFYFIFRIFFFFFFLVLYKIQSVDFQCLFTEYFGMFTLCKLPLSSIVFVRFSAPFPCCLSALICLFVKYFPPVPFYLFVVLFYDVKYHVLIKVFSQFCLQSNLICIFVCFSSMLLY